MQHNIKNDIEYQRLRRDLDRLQPDRLEACMSDIEKKAKSEEETPLFMSTKEFNEKTGIKIHTLRRLLEKGEIKGKKFSRMWLVYRSEYERLCAESSPGNTRLYRVYLEFRCQHESEEQPRENVQVYYEEATSKEQAIDMVRKKIVEGYKSLDFVEFIGFGELSGAEIVSTQHTSRQKGKK